MNKLFEKLEKTINVLDSTLNGIDVHKSEPDSDRNAPIVIDHDDTPLDVDWTTLDVPNNVEIGHQNDGLPVLVTKSKELDISQASNTLQMSNYDEFNCLVLGCGLLLLNISIPNKRRESDISPSPINLGLQHVNDDINIKTVKTQDVNIPDIDDDDTKEESILNVEKAAADDNDDDDYYDEQKNAILEQCIENLESNFGVLVEKELDFQIMTNELSQIWHIMEKLLDFGDSGELLPSSIVCLAKILHVKTDRIEKLSFVKEYIHDVSNDNNDNKPPSKAPSLMIGNTTNAAPSSSIEARSTEIIWMKEQINLSMFKQCIIKMGCFMDLYNTIVNSKNSNESGALMSKFLAYYYHFDNDSSENIDDSIMLNGVTSLKEHFLLAMSHPQTGDTLLRYIECSICQYLFLFLFYNYISCYQIHAKMT